jgi:hypothetical protein
MRGMEQSWVVAAAADGSGASNVAVVIGLVVLAAGFGVSWYRVSVARRAAREAGLDPNAATRRALTGKDVPEPDREPPPGRPEAALTGDVAERLIQLRSLLDRGLISQAEYDERRRGIIDSI